MKAGRPVGSEIRQNIVEMLYFLGKAHGYAIYKIYINIFPVVSIRSVYYHLRKGAQLDEFKLEVTSKSGDYSWGHSAEVIYYSIGPNARPTVNKRVKEYIDSLKLSKKAK